MSSLSSLDRLEHVEDIMKKLNIIYYDARSLLNRSKIKRWISDIEKIVTKINPDFIVMKGCSRYLLFELNRKEWCKYYFISIPYNPTPPSGSPTRTHLVLSRYPISTNSNFGSPLIHIVGTTISFNDIPMRYEYEDPSVQSINVERITLIITDDHDSTEQHATDFQAIVQEISQRPHTIFLFGLNDHSPLKPIDLKQIDTQTENINDNTNSPQPPDICYTSNAWKFDNSNNRIGHLQFKMIEFE